MTTARKVSRATKAIGRAVSRDPRARRRQSATSRRRSLGHERGALQSKTSIQIRIEGDADDSGSDEYNLGLSQKRAAIVNRYFTDRGIDASRIQIVSDGEERPGCRGTDEACRPQKRRDEFGILSRL